MELAAKKIRVENSTGKKMITDDERSTHKVKGGLRTMPFIIVNEAFEKVASFGLLANMILYLTTQRYQMDYAKGANVLFIWSAVSNFLPIIGAFISDSYLGRFRVITIGSISSLLGMTLLWLTTVLPSAKPHQKGEAASHSQLALLFSSFVFMSIGAGGIRPCSLAFGADQFYDEDNPKNETVLQSFFNWYFASVGVSFMIAVTVIVYIQDNLGWKVGFGVPALLMLLSTVTFLLGSPFCVMLKIHKSLLTGFAQVIVVALKNRHLDLPAKHEDGRYHYHEGSNLVAPSQKLRFLNKACLLTNQENNLYSDKSAAQDPWTLCTVKQVEDFKSLIKVIPLWSTGITIALTFNQHAFPVLQARTMDRHMTSKFQIPAGSFSIFGMLTLTIWVSIYDRLIVPHLAKYTGRPRGLSHKQRMGIGLIISCIATSVAALVENLRRRTAIQQGLINNPSAVVNISAMWLVPQHCLTGLAEAFNAIGQIDFYYTVFPKTMASIGVALFALGMAIANLVGSGIISILDEVTKRHGRESWVSNNLNKGRYDYYYWILTILGMANFAYFLLCSWCYGDVDEPLPETDEEIESDGVKMEDDH